MIIKNIKIKFLFFNSKIHIVYNSFSKLLILLVLAMGGMFFRDEDGNVTELLTNGDDGAETDGDVFAPKIPKEAVYNIGATANRRRLFCQWHE